MSLMIHSDLMNTLSLCTAPNSNPEPPLMEQLDLHTHARGWIWSAGENKQGFWCEIFTPTEVRLFQGVSFDEVLDLALRYTTKNSTVHVSIP